MQKKEITEWIDPLLAPEGTSRDRSHCARHTPGRRRSQLPGHSLPLLVWRVCMNEDMWCKYIYAHISLSLQISWHSCNMYRNYLSRQVNCASMNCASIYVGCAYSIYNDVDVSRNHIKNNIGWPSEAPRCACILKPETADCGQTGITAGPTDKMW